MYLFQSEEIDYLFFPNEFVGFEGDVVVIEEEGKYDWEYSVLYVGDNASDIELEDYGECDIAIVPIGNGLNILDRVVKLNNPKIVLLRGYRNESMSSVHLQTLGENLSGLSDRGLIKFSMNPCYVNYPKYREIWLFCVGGDTEESILRGDRDYEFTDK
jgi:hypothetical protein